MASMTLPIDLSRFGEITFLSATAKMDRDANSQKTSREGLPAWSVQALRQPPAAADGYQPKAELIDVTLYATAEPALAPMTPVFLVEPVARTWEMNGRSGVSITASEMRPAHAERAAKGE